MYTASDLVFPVLCFASDASMMPAESFNELTLTTPQAVEQRFYESLTIVDSSGLLYTVQSAVVQKTKGVSAFLRSTLLGTVAVELAFSPSRRAIDAETLKEMLKRDLPRWEDKEAAQEYRDSLENFTTVQELIADWFPPSKKEN